MFVEINQADEGNHDLFVLENETEAK